MAAGQGRGRQQAAARGIYRQAQGQKAESISTAYVLAVDAKTGATYRLIIAWKRCRGAQAGRKQQQQQRRQRRKMATVPGRRRHPSKHPQSTLLPLLTVLSAKEEGCLGRRAACQVICGRRRRRHCMHAGRAAAAALAGRRLGPAGLHVTRRGQPRSDRVCVCKGQATSQRGGEYAQV
ncbi:hypothetical protein ABPG75_001079 [Micractinium tetrahymenae]